MKKIQLILILLLSALACYSQQVKAIQPNQKIRNYVTDESNTLTSSQISSLEQKLKRFEDSTSNQLVVYIVKSLDDGSLEEMSYDIAQKNGIGQKGKDNGVLLFIAMEDRKLRIEVGYGLEGALTDALSGQIIRNEITPYFKQKKYYEGINAGVDAIILATRGEYKADNKKKSDDGTVCCGIPIFAIIIFGFIFFFVILPIILRLFGKGGGRGSGTPWIFTGGSSGWSSGSSSGFGGFSGGGGSFGGGGSSGSW